MPFLQTDPLERHFGLYGMMSGANYHISYCQVLERERRLKFSTILKMFSKLQVNELALAEFISSFSDPSDTSDTASQVDNSIYSSLLSNLSDIHLYTATLQSLAFIGGKS